MKIHGRRLGAYDRVKEASLRRLQTVGFPVEGTLNKHRGREILVSIPVIPVIIHVSPRIECTTKVNLNANHGRWVTMMCRSINYNRCITQVGLLIVEEAMPVCV